MAQTTGELPQQTQVVLQRMTTQLVRALGDSLIAVVLYGSAARGDYDPAHSDINLLLVLDEVSTDNCEAIQEPLHVAQREAAIHLEMMTPQEIERSADVFPLLFLDIQRAHELLHGDDPLAKINIAWDHLRLRVEQQIKSQLFDLRRWYLTYQTRPERLGMVLKQAVGKFLGCIGALLYLQDPQWWITGKEHIGEMAVEHLGFDGPLMQQLIQLHRNTLHPTASQVKTLYDHFLALNEDAADLVDQLVEVPSQAEPAIEAALIEQSTTPPTESENNAVAES